MIQPEVLAAPRIVCTRAFLRWGRNRGSSFSKRAPTTTQFFFLALLWMFQLGFEE